MSNKAKILDIAMNLNRIGNLAADDYNNKQKRINIFLDETNSYIESVDKSSFSHSFKNTFEKFLKEYKILNKERNENSFDSLHWAEKMMTWGNILTHRTKVI